MTGSLPPPPPGSSSPPAPPKNELPPRLRRAIELVYALEGVVAVRVWQWPGSVALGVATSPPGDADVLRRVEVATASLREPDERWELGWLEPDGDRASPVQ